MSQADALLDTMAGESSETMMLGVEEEHIVVGIDRFIQVPDALKRIAVQYDHNIETVTFDCPRYWDDHDMSTMRVYINYMRADKAVGCYLTESVTIDADDETIMHFDWVISQNVTLAKGTLSFLVCIKSVDAEGNEEAHWNSELNQDMFISVGLECEETIIELEPDLISAVLTRMENVEALVQPDVLSGYINDYLNNNPEMVEAALNTIVTPEAMQGYVDNYLDENSVRVDLDTTLSVEGQAADAKATGNAIVKAITDATTTINSNTNTKLANCVQKSGDTMTGTLTVQKNSYPSVTVTDSAQARSAVMSYESDGLAAIQNKGPDNSNRTILRLDNENADIKDLLRLTVVKDNVYTEYPIYHAGNAPSQWHELWLIPFSYPNVTTFDTPNGGEGSSWYYIYLDLPEKIDFSKYLYRFELEVYGLQKYGETSISVVNAEVDLIRENKETTQSDQIYTLQSTQSDQTKTLSFPRYLKQSAELMTTGAYIKISDGWLKGEQKPNEILIKSSTDFGVRVYDRIVVKCQIGYEGSRTPLQTFGMRLQYRISGEKV